MACGTWGSPPPGSCLSMQHGPLQQRQSCIPAPGGGCSPTPAMLGFIRDGSLGRSWSNGPGDACSKRGLPGRAAPLLVRRKPQAVPGLCCSPQNVAPSGRGMPWAPVFIPEMGIPRALTKPCPCTTDSHPRAGRAGPGSLAAERKSLAAGGMH
ncbi:hypothetical protein KIL84_001970 [Mauremys mutica]|uniref:Uncharacterized protein n=1 Tax=Mauremys mutica TaxID=74926 RepID=A0A9D4B581_9SAUR|nr:hypothetical protein KIL84_001970 [Mauremys mutica]